MIAIPRQRFALCKTLAPTFYARRPSVNVIYVLVSVGLWICIHYMIMHVYKKLLCKIESCVFK